LTSSVGWCAKIKQAVGVRGALLGYFLGKQKVTKKPKAIALVELKMQYKW
jgi:hypothetical protein